MKNENKIWRAPQLFEIKMDAEIGSYQVDDPPREPEVSTRERRSPRVGAAPSTPLGPVTKGKVVLETTW